MPTFRPAATAFMVGVLSIAGAAGAAAAGGIGDALSTLGITREEAKDARSRGLSAATIAAEQGVALDDLIAAIAAPRLDDLAAEAAAEGWSAEQLAAATAALQERVATRVEQPLPGPSEKGRAERDAVLTALGISADELRDGRTRGLSLAALAAEQGVSRDALVAALLAPVAAHITAEAAERGWSAEEVAARTAEAAAKIGARVDAPMDAPHGDGARPGKPQGTGNGARPGTPRGPEASPVAP